MPRRRHPRQQYFRSESAGGDERRLSRCEPKSIRGTMKNLMIGTAITLLITPVLAAGAAAADLRIPRLASIPDNGYVSRSHAVPDQPIVSRPQKNPQRRDR